MEHLHLAQHTARQRSLCDVCQGEWQQGKRHGRGRYEYADGGGFEGVWVDDRIGDIGVRTFVNGDKVLITCR